VFPERTIPAKVSVGNQDLARFVVWANTLAEKAWSSLSLLVFLPYNFIGGFCSFGPMVALGVIRMADAPPEGTENKGL